MSGRRRRARYIQFAHGFHCFKPCGRPACELETLELRADELEALRLADLEGLYQEASAVRMGISRTTLSRTLAEARRKIADALIHGKRLVVAPSSALDLQVLLIDEDACMKTLVITASDDRGLDGAMSMHFGHCTHFVVARLDADNQVAATEVHANPYAEHHQPGQIPSFIKSLGADVVIAGGMGAKAIQWLEELGVQVATGARETVGAALDAYLAGDLGGAAECNHEH